QWAHPVRGQLVGWLRACAFGARAFGASVGTLGCVRLEAAHAEDLAVAVDEAQGTVVSAGEGKSALVQAPVVLSAQQHHVLQSGRSAVGPVHDVVTMQVTAPCTGRKDAAAVPIPQRP